MKTPDAPFTDPWHAQLFALTVALSDGGRFSWADWTRTFGATLARHRQAQGPLDGEGDYWAAWLETLESLLDARAMTSAEGREATRAAWERAYLSTPHGQPVRLS